MDNVTIDIKSATFPDQFAPDSLKNTKEFLKKKQITIKREIFLDPINLNSIVIALQNILYINFPWY